MGLIRLIRTGEKGFKRVWPRLMAPRDREENKIEASVRAILRDVRERGDAALLTYTQRFDHLKLTPDALRISREECEEAEGLVDPAVVEGLRCAADRIVSYHTQQKREGFVCEKEGVRLEERILPLERVGVYVPGGRASYPSSVLMNVLPARVAGVSRIVMCTPTPRGEINPAVLVAAHLAGVDEIYRVGGAQAIGALAYGTETVPRVDKIVGPGNIYVAIAKRCVFGDVGVDMIAGPSELVIIADETGDPVYLAADLLCQAEHDEEALSLLVTPSEKLAHRVDDELSRQLALTSRRSIIRASLRSRGAIILVDDLFQAVDLVNEIAPEHCEIVTADPERWGEKVRHAGALLLGPYTSPAVGDYVAGPNHVLPTGGTARFSSPLSVDEFIKKSHVITYSGEALSAIAGHVVTLARAEGLSAHGRTVEIRVR